MCSAMALKFNKQALKQMVMLKMEVTCKICLDVYTEPITLTFCQHTFCLTCFKKLFSNKKSSASVTCPLCKRPIKFREFYTNDNLGDVVDTVRELENMLEDEDPDDDRYDLVNRMRKFLDDCVTYRDVDVEECVSLSAEDSTDVTLLKPITNKKSPKTPFRKTKSLKCTKIKGKHPKRLRKTAEDKFSETLKIEEYDSSDVCEQKDEETKIVKLLEDDCLRNFEKEIQNDKENEFCSTNKKTKKRSNTKNKSKIEESSSSKKTETSTGWSRMKKMKKQIKKKEIKYKQLNVSTEINKSKSKSPQNVCNKNSSIEKDAIVVLKRLSSENSNKKVKKEKSIECKNEVVGDSVFSMCTQDIDEINMCTPEKKSNSFGEKHFGNDTEINMTNFIVGAQIHRSSTPKKLIEPVVIIVDKACSKPSLQENICDFEEIKNLSKECKNKRSRASSRSSDVEIINSPEKTSNLKELEPRTRRNLRSIDVETTPSTESLTKTRRILRSASKRSLDDTLKNKSSPKKRRLIKQNSKESIDKSVASSKTEEIQKNEECDSNEIIDSKKLDFVKNELQFFSKQETTVITALQNSMNAIKVVLSQCSNYVNSESLFSESINSKSKNDKPNTLSINFHSLPLPSKSNSRSSVEFNETVIPCLKKIQDYYNNVISLSQKIRDETENIRNKFSCNKDNEKLVTDFKLKKDVEIQTENFSCPNCSYIIDLKSANKTNSAEKTTLIDYFKELNDINSIHNEKVLQNSNTTNQNNIVVTQDSNTISRASTGESNLVHSKKVNRQLVYSEESNQSRRKFKRIRSPTSDTDSESIKSKKTNISSIHRSKFLCRDDIDILFESEPSDKCNLSFGSLGIDKIRKKIIEDAEKNKPDPTGVNIFESEAENDEFNKISQKENEKPSEKPVYDTAHILDNLLGNIHVSEFENDFEASPNTTSNTTQKDNLNQVKVDSNPTMSASLFLQTEFEGGKYSDGDKTKSIEKQLEIVTRKQNMDEKKLDEEVENLTSHDIVIEDSLESGKDLFKEDDIVENTPQKIKQNSTSNLDLPRPLLKIIETPLKVAENFNTSNLDLGPIFQIIEPPPTVTENLDWIEIAPPPPPEFQDTEVVEQPKPINTNLSSLTPDIFGLNPLNKAFFADGTLLSGNTTVKQATQHPKDTTFSENVIPGTDTGNQNSIIEPKITNSVTNFASTSKKNLNPIVLAQKEKFSPLQLVVNQNPVPKPINLTQKHQQSILSFMKTSQKEKPSAKQNQSNIVTPVKENIPREVCESPEREITTNQVINKLSNESSANVSLPKSKYSAYIACSRIKKDEIIQIISLTHKVQAKYCRDFDKNVTHMVVSVDDQNRLYDQTIKYVLAIANSIWVVSFAWIRDSIKQNRLLPEEPYEVLDVSGKPGPKISRLTRLTNPLLTNFVFCCIDPFVSVNKIDIENAILNLGGEIIRNPIEFAKKVGKNCLILVQTLETQDFDHYQVWRENFNVLVVDIEWFSRSVGLYQIISVRPYLLCLEKGINDLGYPFALIAPVPETLSMSMTNTTNH